MNDAAFRTIWEDQAAFNRLLRQPPSTEAERMQQTREIVLHLESELHELLSTYSWKFHRKQNGKTNEVARAEELADIFKLFLTLAEIQGATPATLQDAYWRKTAVVRQRFAQEWMHTIDRPYVIVDIDNVLCDWIGGILDWCVRRYRTIFPDLDRLQQIKDTAAWIDHEHLGIAPEIWREMQHHFRINGGNLELPVFIDAQRFLQSCRDAGLFIVLLTSRPVDAYPNVYTDTLAWLAKHGLPFDNVWWATDKAAALHDHQVPKHLLEFVVEDDVKYVRTLRAEGFMPIYWLLRTLPANQAADERVANMHGVTVVRSLNEIVVKEER